MPNTELQDHDDLSLERLVDMFDLALTSSDPRIIDALRNLMMISTLVAPETTSRKAPGPLRKIMQHIESVDRRVSQLERSASYNNIKYGPGPGMTTWTDTTAGFDVTTLRGLMKYPSDPGESP
jgi:hypothetical protein